MERQKCRNSSNMELRENFIYGFLKHETITWDVNRQPHQYINRVVYKITMSGSPLCIYKYKWVSMYVYIYVTARNDTRLILTLEAGTIKKSNDN